MMRLWEVNAVSMLVSLLKIIQIFVVVPSAASQPLQTPADCSAFSCSKQSCFLPRAH